MQQHIPLQSLQIPPPSDRQPSPGPPSPFTAAKNAMKVRSTDQNMLELAMPRRKILVASDGSAPSLYAYKWACVNIFQPGDAIVVLRVLGVADVWHASEGLFTGKAQDRLTAAESLVAVLNQTADLILAEHIKILKELRPELHDVTVLSDIKMGEAKEEILDLASSLRMDMIIVGDRGLGKIKRLFMGSVSDYVVKSASVPVLVCHPPPGTKMEEGTPADGE
ncbi:hypothetical protein HDV05_002595 [Chytridiales sp. JEL 0842]|nr:hypothetical protein HDV05_002595 [Chytridiales sp. JEL 0842]